MMAAAEGAEKPRSKRQKLSVQEEDGEEEEEEEDQEAAGRHGGDDRKKGSTSSHQLQRNDGGGDAYLALRGNKKRLTVRKFQGRVLVDIREYYEKDGKMLPGKKGISLTVEQYEEIRDAAGSIDAEIARLL